MSKNAVYGYRMDDEDDYNFYGFLVEDGSRLEATDEPIRIPEDKQSDQEFITDLLIKKRDDFIHQAYVCGPIKTKKISEWVKSL